MSEPTTPVYDGLADAKRLLRTVRSGALATLQPEGEPFASLVSVATLIDGRPILLLSRLSAHTQHLLRDPRCSLLLAEGGKGDPLAHARLTLTGQAVCLTEPAEVGEARARFLSRQPKAGLYADFPDFSFWRVTPRAAHLNGGFAKAARLDGEAVLVDAGPLAAIERGAVEHMNADHKEALALYGAVLAGAGAGAWTASGLDPDGIDLVCGDRVAARPLRRADRRGRCSTVCAEATRRSRQDDRQERPAIGPHRGRPMISASAGLPVAIHAVTVFPPRATPTVSKTFDFWPVLC